MGGNKVGDMLRRARRREGAGYTEDDNLFTLDLCQYIDLVRAECASLGFNIDKLIQRASRQVVTNLNHRRISKKKGGREAPSLACPGPPSRRESSVCLTAQESGDVKALDALVFEGLHPGGSVGTRITPNSWCIERVVAAPAAIAWRTAPH